MATKGSLPEYDPELTKPQRPLTANWIHANGDPEGLQMIPSLVPYWLGKEIL